MRLSYYLRKMVKEDLITRPEAMVILKYVGKKLRIISRNTSIDFYLPFVGKFKRRTDRSLHKIDDSLKQWRIDNPKRLKESWKEYKKRGILQKETKITDDSLFI